MYDDDDVADKESSNEATKGQNQVEGGKGKERRYSKEHATPVPSNSSSSPGSHRFHNTIEKITGSAYQPPTSKLKNSFMLSTSASGKVKSASNSMFGDDSAL